MPKRSRPESPESKEEKVEEAKESTETCEKVKRRKQAGKMSTKGRTSKVVQLKFANCLNSISCTGCTASDFESDDDTNSTNNTIIIHNKDVITYEHKAKPEWNRFYEFLSTYKSEVQADGSVVPREHNINIQQFRRFKEVESLPGPYACGGCSFLLQRRNLQKNKKLVLCANGWPGYEDGWQ